MCIRDSVLHHGQLRIGLDRCRHRVQHLSLIHIWHPLLPLDIFQSRRYSFAVLTSLTMFIAQGIALVALPFVLQDTYAYTALESALVFTPWPIAVAVCAPFAGRLANRFNATQVSSIGVFTFCPVSYTHLSSTRASSSPSTPARKSARLATTAPSSCRPACPSSAVKRCT